MEGKLANDLTLTNAAMEQVVNNQNDATLRFEQGPPDRRARGAKIKRNLIFADYNSPKDFWSADNGHLEFPPTLWFFRNTLGGDLLFTGLFASVMEWIAYREKEPSLIEENPKGDEQSAETAEEA